MAIKKGWKLREPIYLLGDVFTFYVVDAEEDISGGFNYDKNILWISLRSGLSVLLHEVLERTFSRNNLRFYGGESAMEYRFFMDHTQFSVAIDTISYDLFSLYEKIKESFTPVGSSLISKGGLTFDSMTPQEITMIQTIIDS